MLCTCHPFNCWLWLSGDSVINWLIARRFPTRISSIEGSPLAWAIFTPDLRVSRNSWALARKRRSEQQQWWQIISFILPDWRLIDVPSIGSANAVDNMAVLRQHHIDVAYGHPAEMNTLLIQETIHATSLHQGIVYHGSRQDCFQRAGFCASLSHRYVAFWASNTVYPSSALEASVAPWKDDTGMTQA